jgi:hypothetical protein
MTQTLTAHFDGRVIVPDQPVDLPQHERLVVTVRAWQGDAEPQHGTTEFVLRQIGNNPMSDEDAQIMRAAIEEACERIDPDPDVELDSSDR